MKPFCCHKISCPKVVVTAFEVYYPESTLPVFSILANIRFEPHTTNKSAYVADKDIILVSTPIFTPTEELNETSFEKKNVSFMLKCLIVAKEIEI